MTTRIPLKLVYCTNMKKFKALKTKAQVKKIKAAKRRRLTGAKKATI